VGKEVFLKNVRICYAQNLFKATAFKEGQTLKYNAQFVIPRTDTANLKLMEDACLAAAEEAWPKEGIKVIKSIKDTDSCCLRNGEKQPDREELEDAMYVAASNRKRPTTLNRDRTAVTEEDGVIYSGCYVNAKIDVYGFTVEKTKKGVYAELRGVQFVRDGDAFAGGAKVADADAFADISDTGADDSSDLF
jgi:hypothetical protein